MNHHVGASDFGPYLLGQCAGTPRQMGVGDEQKTHGFSVPQQGAVFAATICTVLSGRPLLL